MSPNIHLYSKTIQTVFPCLYWIKQFFFTGSVRVQVEQLPVSTHVAGGNPDTRGTASRVSLVPPVATVRHSHSVLSQHRQQTAYSGELLLKFISFTSVLQRNWDSEA